MSEALAIGDPFQLCGGVLADRFRVRSTVAEGGFGVVYRGVQLVLDRSVAIKVLKTPPHLSGEELGRFRERFAAEAKIIARLKHPHIVDVYDFGVGASPGGDVIPWMALEWLDGVTLEADLEARRAAGQRGRSPREALELMRPILQAFAMAHRQGIVHRDIKPANIMLSEDETGARVPKILDFGISKIVGTSEEEHRHTGTSSMPAFSPAYAAPEQVTFSRTGTWTDVHALGLVLSELLTDRPPYSAVGLHLFEQVMLARRPTPGASGVDVGAWEEVLQKAVTLVPGARWQNATELLAALEARAGDLQDATGLGEAGGRGARRATRPLAVARSGLTGASGGTKILPTLGMGPAAPTKRSSSSEKAPGSPKPSPSLMPVASTSRVRAEAEHQRQARDVGSPAAQARRFSRVRFGLIVALVLTVVGVSALLGGRFLRDERAHQDPTAPVARLPPAHDPIESPTPKRPEVVLPSGGPSPSGPLPGTPPTAGAPSAEDRTAPASPRDPARHDPAKVDTPEPEGPDGPLRPHGAMPAKPPRLRPDVRPLKGVHPKGPGSNPAPLQPLPIEIE